MKQNEFNFIGIDTDLETSLVEYNLLCTQDSKDCTEKDEYFCIYKVSENNFDAGYIKESELHELIDGKGWMNKKDIKSLLSFVGCNLKKWKKLNFVSKLHDLISYRGYENIFGTAYYPLNLDKIKEIYPQIF